MKSHQKGSRQHGIKHYDPKIPSESVKKWQPAYYLEEGIDSSENQEVISPKFKESPIWFWLFLITFHTSFIFSIVTICVILIFLYFQKLLTFKINYYYLIFFDIALKTLLILLFPDTLYVIEIFVDFGLIIINKKFSHGFIIGVFIYIFLIKILGEILQSGINQDSIVTILGDFSVSAISFIIITSLKQFSSLVVSLKKSIISFQIQAIKASQKSILHINENEEILFITENCLKYIGYDSLDKNSPMMKNLIHPYYHEKWEKSFRSTLLKKKKKILKLYLCTARFGDQQKLDINPINKKKSRVTLERMRQDLISKRLKYCQVTLTFANKEAPLNSFIIANIHDLTMNKIKNNCQLLSFDPGKVLFTSSINRIVDLDERSLKIIFQTLIENCFPSMNFQLFSIHLPSLIIRMLEMFNVISKGKNIKLIIMSQEFIPYKAKLYLLIFLQTFSAIFNFLINNLEDSVILLNIKTCETMPKKYLLKVEFIFSGLEVNQPFKILKTYLSILNFNKFYMTNFNLLESPSKECFGIIYLKVFGEKIARTSLKVTKNGHKLSFKMPLLREFDENNLLYFKDANFHESEEFKDISPKYSNIKKKCVSKPINIEKNFLEPKSPEFEGLHKNTVSLLGYYIRRTKRIYSNQKDPINSSFAKFFSARKLKYLSLRQDMHLETNLLKEENSNEMIINNKYEENDNIKHRLDRLTDIVLKRPIVNSKLDPQLNITRKIKSRKDIYIEINKELIAGIPQKEGDSNYKIELEERKLSESIREVPISNFPKKLLFSNKHLHSEDLQEKINISINQSKIGNCKDSHIRNRERKSTLPKNLSSFNRETTPNNYKMKSNAIKQNPSHVFPKSINKNLSAKKSVLVILYRESDNEKINEIFVPFQKDSITVRVYSNGIEAAEVFRNSIYENINFFLVFIDLNLNFIGGFETAQIMRSIEKSLFWNPTYLCGIAPKITEEIIEKCNQYEINKCIEEPLTKEKLDPIFLNLSSI